MDRCALTLGGGAPVLVSIVWETRSGGRERERERERERGRQRERVRERERERAVPHRESAECLPLHAADEQSSHSYVCQLTHSTRRTRLPPLRGFRSPTAGLRVFSGEPPPAPPPPPPPPSASLRSSPLLR